MPAAAVRRVVRVIRGCTGRVGTPKTAGAAADKAGAGARSDVAGFGATCCGRCVGWLTITRRGLRRGDERGGCAAGRRAGEAKIVVRVGDRRRMGASAFAADSSEPRTAEPACFATRSGVLATVPGATLGDTVDRDCRKGFGRQPLSSLRREHEDHLRERPVHQRLRVDRLSRDLHQPCAARRQWWTRKGSAPKSSGASRGQLSASGHWQQQ